MSDLIIKIEKNTRQVILNQNHIGNDQENLQENLIFQFDNFVDGQARLEYKIDEVKNYIILTKEEETYTIPVQNVITKYQEDTKGKIEFQLVITEGTEEENIPVFKSNIFYLRCRPSINAVTQAPEGYDLWIEQANAKLNAMDEALTEVDNLDIDVSKTGNISTVTITKKDGTEQSVEINDGESLIPGGTTGQVLAKKSNADGDVEWQDVGGNEIYIGNEQDAPATTKLLIDEDGADFIGSEVVNSLEGNQTNKAPSVKAINDKFGDLGITNNDLPFAISDNNGNNILEIDENGNISTMNFSTKNISKIPLTNIANKVLSSTETEGVLEWVDSIDTTPTLHVPWLIEQHRGWSSNTVAENTLAAFKRSWLNGVDMIELDARLSADNVYICCHDASVTDINGNTYVIANENANVLTNLVLSVDPEYGECKVPTTEEVLRFCAHAGLLCNLDCKSINPQTIAELVNKCGMSGKVIYANTDADDSENINNALGILQYDKHASFLFKLLSGAISKWETGLANNPEVLERSWCWKESNKISASAIASAHAKGIKVLIATLSSYNQNVFDLQPDCIEFSDIANSKQICEEYLDNLDF